MTAWIIGRLVHKGDISGSYPHFVDRMRAALWIRKTGIYQQKTEELSTLSTESTMRCG